MPSRKLQKPGREPQQHDREQVEDALDEDRAEGLAQRDVEVQPQQVGAVDVAELGRARGS